MIEEGDGSVSSYAVDNTIETVLNTGESQPKSVDLSRWPNITMIDQNENLQKFKLDDIGTPIIENSGSIHGKTDFYFQNIPLWNAPGGIVPTLVWCQKHRFRYNIKKSPSGVIDTGSSGFFGIESNGTFFRLNANSAFQALSGFTTNNPSVIQKYIPGTCYFDISHGCAANAFCQSQSLNPGDECGYVDTQWQGHGSLDFWLRVAGVPYGADASHTVAGTPCGYTFMDQVEIPKKGFQDGPAGATQFNTPVDLKKGFGNNLVVADYGNNRIRSISLVDFSTTTIVGNGGNRDIGDGGLATSAEIYHPLTAIYDGSGNLYIATERGLIRKVDTNGIITRFAGKLPEEGGILTDSTHASKMVFNRPMGLVIDEDRGFMYVADTGNNRVVQIDLESMQAQVIAGSGQCDPTVVDGLAAVNSSLCSPEEIGLDENGNLLIVDNGHHRIRRVNFSSNTDGKLTYLAASQDGSTLTRSSVGIYTRTYRNGTKAYFDQFGRHYQTQDRLGRTISFDYDTDGNLIKRTEPTGQETVYSYSGGHIESVTDPAGRTTEFEFTGDLLTKVTFPDQSERTYNYDANGLLDSETNQRGFTTRYEYNEYHRLQKVVRPDGKEIVINDSASATMANNFTGGSSGQLKSYGIEEGEAYDGIKDAKNQETKFVKDTNGYITTIVDSLGNKTEITRNALGLAEEITRADGSKVTYSYDPSTYDLLQVVDTHKGETKTYKYDQLGNQTESMIGTGLKTTRQFDPTTGLLLSELRPNLTETHLSYNEQGLVTREVAKYGGSSLKIRDREYDSSGNLIRLADSSGQQSLFDHDAAGNLTKRTDVRGTDDHLITRYSFDFFNRLLGVTSPTGDVTGYSYLSTGELKQIIDPKGNTVLFDYDSLGQVVKKTDPFGEVELYSYDDTGNLQQFINRNGQTATYEYNVTAA